MLQKYLALFCWMFVWVGCALKPSPTATPDPLAYSHDPETMVIYADVYFYPPLELFYDDNHYQFRAYIPPLRIWGNGKTILITSNGEQREILMGVLSEDDLDEIFSILKQGGAFEPEIDTTPQIIHGSYAYLNIYLMEGKHHIPWSADPPKYYDEIIQYITPLLTPYMPDHAQLFVSESTVMFGWEHDPLFGLVVPKAWPDKFGLSLANFHEQGMEITGPMLNFIWDETNASPYALRFREGDKVYWIKLEGLREDLYVTPTPIPPPTQTYPYPIPPTETLTPPVFQPAYPYPTR